MQEEEKEKEKKAKIKEPSIEEEDIALNEMTLPTAKEVQNMENEKALEKHEQLCKLSRALAVLASASVSVLNYVYPYILLFL